MTTEDILRFRPAEGQGHRGKPNEHTNLLANSLGYEVRRVLIVDRKTGWRHNPRPAHEVWDAFAPDGRLLGVEPTRYWAMRVADAHMMGGR